MIILCRSFEDDLIAHRYPAWWTKERVAMTGNRYIPSSARAGSPRNMPEAYTQRSGPDPFENHCGNAKSRDG